MPTTPLLDQTLGDLALGICGATTLFHRYALDFCCGGEQTLGRAAAAAGLDAAEIAQGLHALVYAPQDNACDWRSVSQQDLIDHLINRYHEVHRKQLPELLRLARKVEAVHAGRPECPHGLADHLRAMAQEMELHMQKEERILFPLLLKGIPPEKLPPVEMMRLEHKQHGQALAQMMILARQLVMPEDVCPTWRALHAGLSTFRSDLMDHIHLENNLLFRQNPG